MKNVLYVIKEKYPSVYTHIFEELSPIELDILIECSNEFANLKINELSKANVIKSVCVCKEKRGTFLGADNKYRCSKCFELVEQTVL